MENSNLGICLVCRVSVVRNLVTWLFSVPEKFAIIFKKPGHVIKECPIHPPRKTGANYVVATTLASSSAPPPTFALVSEYSNLPYNSITPEMIQQMVISALSALCVLSNPRVAHSSWLLDSSASNHITHDHMLLSKFRPYTRPLNIHSIDGNTLLISAVGDISSDLPNVLVSPSLSTNLISIGQLVDNNCIVSFSSSCCHVQDQVSRGRS